MAGQHEIVVEWSARHEKFIGYCSARDFKSKPHADKRKILRAGEAHCEEKNGGGPNA